MNLDPAASEPAAPNRRPAWAGDDPVHLVRRIEASDPEAEATLVARYGRAVSLLLARHTGGRPEAEDLFQDTFTLAIGKLRRGELRDPSRLPGYLASIARSLATEHYRKHLRRKTEADSETVVNVATAPASQLGDLLLGEKAGIVRQLIDGLHNERDRNLLMRYYVAEEDRVTIAADFGVDNLQLNRLLYRARQRYKKLYLAYRNAEGRAAERAGFAAMVMVTLIVFSYRQRMR